MAYGNKVIDHFNNPRNVGTLDKSKSNVGTGLVGAPECGDVMRLQIEVNDNIILDNDISVIDILGDIKTISKDIEGPKTKGLLLTIVQHQEGIICDTIFVLDDEFDLSKVCFVKKNIRYNLDNPCMSTLYCELYYDGELIPLIDSETDLRTSRLYLEKINNYE